MNATMWGIVLVLIVVGCLAVVFGNPPRPSYFRLLDAHQADRCALDGYKVIQGPVSGDVYCWRGQP